MLIINTSQLTPEQSELIAVYRNKWQSIAMLTEKIDLTSVTTSINAAYEFIDLAKPNILLCSNPYSALGYIYDEIRNSWGKIEDTSLGNPIAGSLVNKLLGKIRIQIGKNLLGQLQGNLDDGLANSIASETVKKIQETKWDIFYGLITNSGWIFPYKKTAIICQR